MNVISGVANNNSNIIIDGKTLQNEALQGTPVELKNGATISGKVLSFIDTEEGKFANIDIGNGTISAKLSEEMGLKEGQFLNFIVRGTNERGVTISPLFENTSLIQSTLKALQAAGLEVNNESIKMVRDMMEAGLPINKASLWEMNKNVSNFMETPVSTMVEMKSLGIPINENTIEQYSNYKNYEHQVINEMTTIVDELPKAFSALSENGNSMGAVNLYGSLLKIFGESPEVPQSVGEIVAESSEQVVPQETTLGEREENVIGDTIKNPEAESKTEVLNEKVQVDNSDVPKDMPKDVPVKNDNQQINNLNPDILTTSAQPDTKNIDTNPGQSLLTNGLKQSTTDIKDIKLSNDFVNNLQNLNVPEKNIQALVKAINQGDLSATKQLFKELSTAFESADMTNSVEIASWKKIFSSDDFNKLLKENISSQWMLNPEEVEKKENVDNLYQRLGNQVKALSQTLNNVLGENSNISQSANNLSNNIDFMNQLNHMFQYVQLPLQMTGQNANGDLYVYRNKNKRLSEDGSVSAILHLDMDNLGPLDVYVRMLDKKVTTNFYVADVSIIDLINDNIHILNERLEKRGYSMKATLKLQDDLNGEDAAVDEMLSVQRMPIVSTTSFDARA
ncbi:flagellar hook-length control protein FliK [Butyrivibrio sp. YAB3001]|uniref:flagellar hook-length control protein FliK n=1 Tax=Butyrivibrio sp. YAB3001 TaxID=1520812 RepID=UPI0008F66674|nr:flagellar hook-length control protein FliK [Butyrivibrio sp. YAB3001]SFB68601.1 hook-length control protein FliK [Butyrivibrio sp. YAB3001]